MGSARFTGGGIGKVHRWWISFWVECGVWYGFPADMKAHVFLSSSLSHLTLSILGLNLKRIWTLKPILGLFYLFLIVDKFEKLICCMCWEGIFWVCERTICCVCWEGIFWVCEREFFGFMNESLLGLWKGDFLDYQLGEKNVQILRLTLPRKCLIKFYFV